MSCADFPSSQQYIGAAVQDLSVITELDFEQPNALWSRVFDDGAKERFVANLSDNMKGVKSPEVLARAISVLYVLICLFSIHSLVHT